MADRATALPLTRRMTDTAGRTIAWCELGDPAGRPALVAHGSPGSRYQLLPLHASARAAGIRLIAPDRPGFGLTDPSEDRAFHSWDDDAIALLDHLGLDSVPVVGFSGGAGYALGLAAAHPDRVERLVLACGMIPGAPAGELRARLPLITLLYRACRYVPWVATAMLEGRGPFRSTRAANVDSWPAGDRWVMTDPTSQALTAPDGAEGMRQGARAAVTDLARYYRALPEPLEAISVPTLQLHGDADVNVPIAVARWARDRLPASRLVEIPDGGHYFLVENPAPLLDALAG